MVVEDVPRSVTTAVRSEPEVVVALHDGLRFPEEFARLSVAVAPTVRPASAEPAESHTTIARVAAATRRIPDGL
jgi:hypothetical protein